MNYLYIKKRKECLKTKKPGTLKCNSSDSCNITAGPPQGNFMGF